MYGRALNYAYSCQQQGTGCSPTVLPIVAMAYSSGTTPASSPSATTTVAVVPGTTYAIGFYPQLVGSPADPL